MTIHKANEIKQAYEFDGWEYGHAVQPTITAARLSLNVARFGHCPSPWLVRDTQRRGKCEGRMECTGTNVVHFVGFDKEETLSRI